MSEATSAVQICQAGSNADIEAVRTLLREYIAWAFTLAEDSNEAPTFQGIDEELAALPGPYAPPNGRLLIAKYEGKLGGCVCLKRVDESICEVKRLYVRPEMRGLNMGLKLVSQLVREAQQAGYKHIILDSHHSMIKAHAIYEEAGFKRVEAPAGFPKNLKPIVVFMECDLSTQ